MCRRQTLWIALSLACLILLWLTPPLAYGQDTNAHIVQPGETLSQIAKEYGVPLIELMRRNGLADANAIYVGQTLFLPDAAPDGATVTHLVQAGETLSQIAERYGVSMAALMAANDLADAGEIYWGQVLRIPSADDAESQAPAVATLSPTATPTSPSPESTPTTPPVDQHMVRPGETASQIAKRYGVRLADLLRVNDLANADLIKVGQVLTIPGDSPAASVEAATPAPVEEAEPTAETQNPAPEASSIPPLAEHPHASLNPTYMVQSGDTPALIALRQGVDRQALLDLNNLSPNAGLTAGQRLLLPATAKELVVETPAERYIVQPGDSLSAIAKSYGLTLAELMSANRLSNPDSISVGESLAIPGRVVEGQQEAVEVGPARNGYFFYTVRRGDTLSELARDLGSTQLALIEYNDLPDESTVFAGMELRVPYGPPPLPVKLPPGPISGSSFLVSLSRQQCWVFQGNVVLHQWNCSTGYGEWRTRTGAFAVQSKIENAKSNAYRLDMPYWLGIYDVGQYENGIHGLPVEWDTGKKIWTRLVGQPATFGCAMLDDADAKTLFDLAYIGMPVYIIQ